jgi:hypothetical protein
MRRTASDAIASWAPVSVPPEAAAFARRVVGAVGPERAERAKALLFATGSLGAYALGVGLELDEEVLLADSVIERFVATGAPGVDATRRTLRANLRFVARAVRVPRGPAPTALPRGRAKAPYARAEIASYLALADAQPTVLRCQRANALVCLGAGAGLIGAELRHVRGSDVVARSGGLLVVVTATSARAVPVLGAFRERLGAAATFFAGRYLVSGRDPLSHNVTNPLIRSLSGGSDLPRLETARLRATYLAEGARRIGLRAFMDAAGITCSQHLGDVVAGLEPASEAEMVCVLTGPGQ